MKEENKELMNKVKECLKDEVTTITYTTWLEPLEILDIDNNQIIINAPNSMTKDYLTQGLNHLIYNTFKYLTNIDRQIIISVNNTKDITNTIDKLPEENTYSYRLTNLNSSYSFDTFIEGDNNSFATRAALGVTENLGQAYNPLFIYGGVGLGKTHLMHAIGNEVLKKDNSKKVLYVTSEKFTNEFINTIKDKTTDSFREKYRNIDVLMIDDIQFIANKERVQEEFFHTFNTLHENGSQIIISSDKTPKHMPYLEERLKSRFEWGLIVDISVPDFETRVAILRKKAELKNVLVDNDILYNIATKIDTNIRELEGAFNKVLAYSYLTLGPITLEMAEKAINDIISQKDKSISIDYIQEVVANYYSLEKSDLIGSKRSNEITYPRQIAMYLCRTIANFSFKQIGEEFGKRDHTTVMHAYKKIEEDIRNNNNTKLIVESVEKLILNKE